MPDRELENQCSMLYWWPRVATLNIPKPETVLLPIEDPALLCGIFDGDSQAGEALNKLAEQAKKAATHLGYPLFLRTDHVSGKHSYAKTCYVPAENALPRHIVAVLEEHTLCLSFGSLFQALVMRRFIPLVTAFQAFWGQLPIAKERRYFIRDGRVECHHPYWIEDAIRFPVRKEPEGWRRLLSQLNVETDEEITLLSSYAERLGTVLSGYWSLDFALGQDGIWYFIDAARGERSWHPEYSKTDSE